MFQKIEESYKDSEIQEQMNKNRSFRANRKLTKAAGYMLKDDNSRVKSMSHMGASMQTQAQNDLKKFQNQQNMAKVLQSQIVSVAIPNISKK